MNKLISALLVLCALSVFASPALAEDAAVAEADGAAAADADTLDFGLGDLGASFGAGLVILGAGFGIGRIGAHAVEGMSRQPEAAGSIQTAMIISAALIEGATFFALIVCLLTFLI